MRSNKIRKALTFTFILLMVFVFGSCSSNKITADVLEEQTILFLSTYFDSSDLDLETCVIDQDSLSEIERYYNDNFSDLMSEDLIGDYIETVGVINMSRIIINSACLHEELTIDNISVTLPDEITQDVNRIEFSLNLTFEDQLYEGLSGVIRFNSEMLVEYFYIIGI